MQLTPATPDQLAYPVLVFLPAFQAVLHDVRSFTKVFAMATERAIKEGLAEKCWVVDSAGRGYRVALLDLGPGPGFWGWRKQLREIRAFTLEVTSEQVDVQEVKTRLVEGLREMRDFWEQEGEPWGGSDIDPDEQIAAVEASQSLKDVMTAMKVGP